MTITGTPGEAYIIATQAGDIINGEEWISATARKQVKVRDPNSACDEYALADQSFTFNKGDKTSMSEKAFNLTGKPTTLTFNAKRGGLKYPWSEQQDMYVEQYANFGSGLEWKQVVSIKPGEDRGKFGPYTLDETATKIRFRSGEYAEQNVTNISVPRKKELEVSETNITEDAERNVRWSKTISVSRSNIDVVDLSVTSSDASCPFVLNKTSIGTDCADRSTETFEVSFTPKEKNKTYTGTITITDGKANPTIRTINLSVATVAFNQAITWNFEDNQVFETTHEPLVFDATTDATGLAVSYKLKDGDEDKATIEGNTLTFTASGTIHVIAYQEGSDRYNAAPEIEKTIIVNKATPEIATNPTVATIKYLDNLQNSQLSEGKATVTLRGVADTEVEGTFTWTNAGQVTNAQGSHDYSITFTPTDGGMYNSNTFTQSVKISRAAGSITMNDGSVNAKVVGVNENLSECKIDLDNLIASKTTDAIDASRAGGVTYEVISDNKANAAIDGNNVFTATAVGTYTIRATQAQTDYYEQATDEFTVTVETNTATFALNKTTLVIDETATLSMTNASGVEVTTAPAGIIGYENGTVKALAAGTATLTVTQPETATHTYKQEVYEVTVNKKTPHLTVQLGGTTRTAMTLGYGATTAFGYADDKASDAEVEVVQVDGSAYVTYANDRLTTYYAPGTAHFKAVLPETKTYYRGEYPFTITVKTPSTYLPISGRSYTIGSGSATNWTHHYETLYFNGMPDKLTFDYAYIFDVEEISIFGKKVNIGNPTRRYDDLSELAQGVLSLGNYSDARKGVGNEHFIYVEESADGTNWHLIWSDDSPVDKSSHPSGEIQLSETTRYIRFHHASNFSNSYTNISVTEKRYVEDPVPSSIDFGKKAINTGKVEKTVYINWCNVAPMRITCSNPRFTVTPDTPFGEYLTSGRQYLTISYTHGTEVGVQEGDITITNDIDTKTIHVSAETTRRPQEIIWNEQLVATGFAMNVGESYPDGVIGYVAAVATHFPVTFTSANSDIIEVVDGTQLVAKAVGSVDITANQAGDKEYQSVSSTKTFVVTNLQKQTITWEQNLLTLLTTSAPVSLTATASSGGAITYTSADESVVKVAGNVLTVVGEGETTVTAMQEGGNIGGTDYLSITQSKSVIVRNPASQCNGVSLSIPSLDLSRSSQVYPLTGMPDSELTFTARHEERTGSVWGGDVLYSELVVEQYACIDGNWGWYEVFKQVVNTSNTSYSTDKIDKTAEKIRFSTAEAATHHISSIRIANRKYMRADITSADEVIEASDVWSKKITVSHSNIDYMTLTTKQGLVTLSTTTLGEGCNDTGDDDFTATFTPLKKNTDYYDTIVITDSKAVPTTIEIPVHFYTQGLAPSISGFELPESCKTTDVLEPFHATASSDLAVTYRSSDNAIAYVDDENRLIILSSGTVDITARQEGDDVYNDAEQTKTIVIHKVTPSVSVLPTASPVTLPATLDKAELSVEEAAMLNDKGAAVPGTYAWSNPASVLTAGEHAYQVTFTPDNEAWYHPTTFEITVNAEKATPAVTPAATAIEQGQTVLQSELSTATGNISGTWSWHTADKDAQPAQGEYTYYVDFTPDDADNYTVLTNVEVKLTVKAPAPFVFSGDGDWTTPGNWNIGDDPETPVDVVVDGNVVISTPVTVGSLTINEGSTVTLTETGSLTLGNEASEDRTAYGDLHVEAGGQVILGNGALKVHDFILDASLGGLDAEENNQTAKSGQVTNAEKIVKQGNAYFDLSFDPSGKISYGWYDFTVPFEVNIAGGIYRIGSTDDRLMVSGTHFMIMEADEANRANGGKGWKNKNSGVLQPGKLYTITFNYSKSFDQNTFRFMWNGNGSLSNGEKYNAQYAAGSEESLRGWNGMGNGMLRHGYPEGNYKMQMYNHSTNTYDLVSGQKTFAVGSAFFVQVNAAGEIDWEKAAATADRPLYAPSREGYEVEEFCLSLRQEDANAAADVLYFSASEEATEAYVIGHDLLKMGTPTDSKVARLWTTKGGKKLCDVEAGLANNNAEAPLSIYAPQTGTYILSADEAPANTSLYLTYNGRVIWNLSYSPYTLDLTKGTTEGYGLKLYVNRIATDIDDVQDDSAQCTKVLMDNKIYIIMPNGAMYDATGKKVQ